MADKPSFSRRLRDVFAKVGFCDSTQELARKPGVIDALVQRALERADTQDDRPQNPPYAARLRAALDRASTSTLECLLENDVTVCLDQRFSQMKSGFFDTEIVAAFYNDKDAKVLSLFDDGTDKGYFLQRGLLDCADDALNGAACEIVKRKDKLPALSFGCMEFNAATKTNTFEWENARGYAKEIRKNRWLVKPPLRKGGNSPGQASGQKPPQDPPRPDKPWNL
ncbi:MAG: hypothetical protein GC185_04365 [Alphaproteobacteria bacterium]|nr:hypothetical protein [Alphaproteobacteria bacterium]